MDKLEELKDLANRILVTIEALEGDRFIVEKPKRSKKVRYAEYVTMTDQEHAKLIKQFGVTGTEDRIDNLNLYKGSTGRKYASDYLTILAWERKNPAPKPKPPDKERQERMI
jgi:hypothetical protein